MVALSTPPSILDRYVIEVFWKITRIDTEAADNVALGVLAPVLAAMAERGSEEALALLDQVAASSTDQEAKEHA
jgi:predicted sugar kinase